MCDLKAFLHYPTKHQNYYKTYIIRLKEGRKTD